MKTRKQVAEYINSGKCEEDGNKDGNSKGHFGLREIRALMDFIYGDCYDEEEKIISIDGEE